MILKLGFYNVNIKLLEYTTLNLIKRQEQHKQVTKIYLNELLKPANLTITKARVKTKQQNLDNKLHNLLASCKQQS